MNIREIVLDFETTGLDPEKGHRIIEIGCVELYNCIPTGRTYQTYINPERDVPSEATKINDIKTEFLKPFPVFAEIVDDFLAFIGQDRLVIHNAPFDLKFLNWELKRLNKQPMTTRVIIDTLVIARLTFPGHPAKLNDLCNRFQIDLSKRTTHGALIDCELLAKVYPELLRSSSFVFLPNK